MKKRQQHKVIYEHDGKWWTADIPTLPGCHSQGKSIEQARTRIREALEVWCDTADEAQGIELVDEIRPSATAKPIIERYQAAKRACDEAEEARKEAEKAREGATRELAEKFNLRDAADMLGLSFQRVSQLAGPLGRRASNKTAKGKTRRRVSA